MIDEEIRKVGEQQLIVRTIRVLPGYYVWVQVKHLQDGLLIVGGVCFPFAIANPPLFQAAKEGNVADVEALLVEGANIDAFGDGESLDIPGWLDGLMVSAFVGHADIVRVFIDKGANVNATSPAYKEYGLEGLTPLMLAALGGHADVVGLLLHNGAKVNATVSSDDDEAKGITALMFAAMKGPIEVVRALLDAGSDVSAKTADGETALDIAEDAQVIQLLKEADAK